MNIKFTDKIRSVVAINVFSITCIPIALSCIFATYQTPPQANAKIQSSISETQLDEFGQNNILFYDPGECIDAGSSGSGSSSRSGIICGDTAAAKTWSILERYFSDPYQIAGIMGNIYAESFFTPVAWEPGVNIDFDGNFTVPWETSYGAVDKQAPGGCGLFAYTFGLGNYLHYMNDHYPESMQYYKDPAKYAYGGSRQDPNWQGGDLLTYGDWLSEKIGAANYEKLLETDLTFGLEEYWPWSKPDDFESYKTTKFNSPADAALAWSNIEAPGIAANERRIQAAELYYDTFKDSRCSSSSNSGNSSNNKNASNKSSTNALSTNKSNNNTASNAAASSSGDNSNNCAKLGELRTAMWNKASDADKKDFMHTVCGDPDDPNDNGEDCSIAGVEGYMNQAISYSNGDLHDWLTGQCPAFRGGVSCAGNHTITSEENSWINEALSGSNNIKFAVGNATGGSSVGAGKIVCVWDGTKCRDDVNYNAEDGKGVCSVYSPSYEFGECWGLEMAEDWAKEISENCGSSGCGTGEFVWYPQFVESKYNGKYSNIEVEVKENPMSSDSGTVKTTMGEIGCGPFSFAMMANMITSKEITPDEVTRVAIETNSIGIEGSYGAVLTKNLAEHYGFEWEKLDNSSNTATMDDITKHLKNGWMIVTGGAGSLPYISGGGHYIGIRGIESDGKWLIADPGHAEEYSQKAWDPKDIITAGMNIDNVYAFKSTSGTCSSGDDDINYCDDSGSGGGSGGGSIGGGVEGSMPIEPIHEDSTNIKCDPRTKDVGVRDDAWYYNRQTYEMRQYSVRLCALPNLPDRDGNSYDSDNLIHVNSRASGAFYSMVEEHNKKCGADLIGSEGYRTWADQKYLRDTLGSTAAAPGQSDHQEGLAVDFDNIMVCANDPSLVTSDGYADPGFLSQFGLENGSAFHEDWHIQVIGTH